MTESDPSSGAEVRRRAVAHVLVGAVDLTLDRWQPDDDTEHHLRRVLRVRDGDLVTATDGAGDWRPFRVEGSASSVQLAADGEVAHEPRPTPVLTIATAIPKGDRVEWLVQKATECGADRIIFLDCDRSVVRWTPERADRHLARLRRIADEALRQSRRVWRTELDGPVPAADVITSAAVAEPGGERLAPHHHTIAIGPEGGWSTAERGTMSLCVELSPHVLRTETAAVVATTLSAAFRHSSAHSATQGATFDADS